MHIIYRGPHWVYDIARWLWEKEGASCRSPIVLHDQNTPLQGTEVYLGGVHIAPRKLNLLKANEREFSIPGLSVPYYAKGALCFLMVRADVRVERDIDELLRMYDLLTDAHLHLRRGIHEEQGRMSRPYVTN